MFWMIRTNKGETMKKILVIIGMLLYPSLANPQKLDPKAFGPFVGSWIGVGCPLHGDKLWAYRIEFFGEQENPYFVLREISNGEESERLRQIIKGTYKYQAGMDTFTFIMPTKTRNVTWMFVAKVEHRVTGVLEGADGMRIGLFFQPEKDLRKDLKIFLQEEKYICR